MAFSRNGVRPFVLPVGALLIAEFAGWLSTTPSYSLAPPSRIAVAAMEAIGDGTLLKATFQTLTSVLTGFTLGALFGVTFGIIFGLNRHLDMTFELPVEAIRATPPIAVLPIWLIIYGLGYQMEISIIAFTTTWPNMVMTRAAVRNVPQGLIEVSKVLGFGAIQRAWKIILPAALPRIFVALRLTLAFSLIIAVTVEIVGNPQGLGSGIMQAREASNPGLMLAFLVWIGTVGVLLNVVMRSVETRLFGRLSVGD
jgi:NitT/TauT family transport system permease protein